MIEMPPRLEMLSAIIFVLKSVFEQDGLQENAPPFKIIGEDSDYFMIDTCYFDDDKIWSEYDTNPLIEIWGRFSVVDGSCVSDNELDYQRYINAMPDVIEYNEDGSEKSRTRPTEAKVLHGWAGFPAKQI